MKNTLLYIIRRALLTLCLMATTTMAWAGDVDTDENLRLAIQSSDPTIRLTADIALTSTLTVNRSVTLDLNGHNLTANGFRAIHVIGGTVTIKSTDAPATVSATGSIADNSSVIRLGDGNDKNFTGSKIDVRLTIDENVTVTTDKCYGITIFGSSTTETLLMNGKVKTTNMPAISGNGNGWLAGTTITIGEKAEVNTTSEVAVYHPQDGTLTVLGTINGQGGIEIKSGQLIVGNEAKITATGTPAHPSINNNGTSTSGYAIAIVENGAYAGVKTINISKTAQIRGSIAVLKDSENTTTQAVEFPDGSLQMLVKITDGTDKIVGQFMTLEEAMAAASAGSTITLTDNLAISSTIETSKDYTLELNGHTVTSDGQRALWIKSGDVTIKSTTTGGRIAVPTLADHDSSAIRVGSDATAAVLLTVAEGVTIAADESYGIIIAGKNTPQTLTVEGAVATKIRPAIAGENGAEQAETTITIASTAVVTTTDEVAIYQPQTGALAVDGKVTGAGGVEIKGGTLTVGSTAKITATAAPSHIANNAGTSSRGYSIAIVENNTINAAGATAVNIDNAATLVGPVAQLQDSPVTSFNPTYTGSAVNKLVAAIGADKYFTLKDAVDIVPALGTVKLLDDLNLSSTLVMEKEKTSTLDLAGHTLTGSNCAAIQITNGHVTIDGATGSTVTVSGTAPAAIQVGGADGSNRAISLTVGEKVTVSSAVSTAVLLSGSKTRETLEVNGTVAATSHSAIVAADEIERLHVAAAANVSASDAVAIYQTNSGELVINGSVSGTGTTAGAIEMKGGNLTVNSGATVAAVGTTSHTASATAPSTNGYAIALVENASFSGVGKANISKDAIITGVVACLVDSKNINAAETLFTGDVTMIAETPNAAGLGEKYAKLPEAIEAAIEGKEVKLLDDLALTEAITLSKAVTLNMDDYSITGNQNSGATVSVSANVTLKNGGIISTKDGINVTAGNLAIEQMTVKTEGVSLVVSGSSAQVIADNATSFTSTAANTIALSAGSLVIHGRSGNSSTVSNNNAIATEGTAALTVSDKAVVSSANGKGIDWQSTGALIINGNVKVMGAEAVNAASGKLTISGGTFTGTGNTLTVGTLADGSAVTGGTFICGTTGQAITSTGITKFVKGGNFSKKIDQSLCKDGYTVSNAPKNNGMYYLINEIVITDGVDWTPPTAEFTIGTARYVRNNGMGANGTQFGTLCLPFSINTAATSGIPSGMKFYAVESISGDCLNLTQLTGVIAAGTPVVFQLTDATTSFMIESTDATISTTTDGLEANNLKGTFKNTVITSGLGDIYYLNSDAFHQASLSLTVPSYRAYIQQTSSLSNARVLYIHTDDCIVTSINSIFNDAEAEGVYDLQGRRQNSLQHGVNILHTKDGRTIKVYVNK